MSNPNFPSTPSDSNNSNGDSSNGSTPAPTPAAAPRPGAGAGAPGGDNFDFASIMEQAQEMQEQMLAAQEAQAKQILVGVSAGEKVQVAVNGNGEIQKVTISPEIVNADAVASLEDSVFVAVKHAFDQVNDLQMESLDSIGLPDIGFGG